MQQKITTFLMFSGNAEEAMNFYISVFEQSKIISIARYGTDEAGQGGNILHAKFLLKGQTFICMDSNVEHQFTFTPAVSLYVSCDSDEEINQTFEKLSEDGNILMPLGPYPFSERYAWIEDKYGVSWQLSLVKMQ